MKILAISDIHGEHTKIIEYLKKHRVDLIILAGDITNFGPHELAVEILNQISSFDIPVLAIPGNCDPVDLYGYIENSNAVNIHCKSVTIKNIGICGFGGSNPTPFNTPLEFDEIEIYDQAKKVMESIKDHQVTLFITHVPPIRTKTDVLPSGVHAGSESIRKIIEELQPTLNICGHIHESMSMDQIGDTKVVNPGMLKFGHACLINIDDSDEENIKVTPEIIEI